MNALPACFVLFLVLVSGCKKPVEDSQLVSTDSIEDDGFVQIFDGKTLDELER